MRKHGMSVQYSTVCKQYSKGERRAFFRLFRICCDGSELDYGSEWRKPLPKPAYEMNANETGEKRVSKQ